MLDAVPADTPDKAPDAHPAMKIHLAGKPPADLDWLEVVAERLGQRTLHQTLEALLELLESHGPPQTNGPNRPMAVHQASDLVTKPDYTP